MPEFSLADLVRQEMLKTIPMQSKVVEFGSGEGTAWMRQNWPVLSFEENEEWALKNPAEGISRVVHSPIEGNWFNAEMVYDETMKFIGDDRFSLLIDGPTWRIGRQGCIPFVEALLDRIDWIIIDDTHRGDETELALALMSITGKRAYEIRDAGKRCAFLKVSE